MSSKVYYYPTPEGTGMDHWIEGTIKICQALGIPANISPNDYVGIKLHVGEGENDTHISWKLIKQIVELAQLAECTPLMIDTSTLYLGQRNNAVKHTILAHKHGFTIENVGAPFILVDGLAGESEREIEIDGELFDSVKVAYDVPLIDYLIVVSHATGHPEAGIGVALKNVGMGLSSRKGKLRQHASMKPQIDPEKCTLCHKCMRWCPADAISEAPNTAVIDPAICIGCGQCLSVCGFGAVKFDWGAPSQDLQKSIAEHCLGILKNKEGKSVFINYCINMTKSCDCVSHHQEKIISDVGILGSHDIVAIDQATLDITRQSGAKTLADIAYPGIDPTYQLEHGQKIGLGMREYELVELS